MNLDQGIFLWPSVCRSKPNLHRHLRLHAPTSDFSPTLQGGQLFNRKAREAARDIDKPDNKTKAIVSVMMLREGWEVKNVTVVLGLRPSTAGGEILPEQVIGRGLRLMPQISPDRTQALEVLGTRNLLNLLRTQLEAKGVGVTTTRAYPPARRATLKPSATTSA